MSEVEFNATLEERRDLNPRYAILRVRPDRRPIAPFTSGQFIQLGLPQPVVPKPGEEPASGPPRMRIAKRSYSIASSANESEGYEFFITRVAGGRLTPELWRIGAGGRCWIDEKALGSFTLERVPPGSDLVMVGTGTGIAPYVSMLRTHGDRPPWNRFVLIHGVRFAEDLGYREELEARASSDARFHYVPIVSRAETSPAGVSHAESSRGGVSREGPRWTGLRGRVQQALEEARFRDLIGAPIDPRTAHVFLCGNPAMIQSVREDLAPRGFTPGTAAAPGNLHFEKYW